MIKILGISAFYHDSAATIIIDGEIVAAAQEERFTRKKHDPSFPFNAIKYVLRESQFNLSEIDHVVFYEKPLLKFERLLKTYISSAPRGMQSFMRSMPLWLGEKIFQKKMIFNNLKKIDVKFSDFNKIKFSEHHFSHAASAFYPSPFNKAIILTLDGVGEKATTTVAIGEKNKIEIKKEIHFPHSLGLFYSAFTYYLGFKVNSGEYKVMGLAPYGEPKYKDKILKNLIQLEDDGSFSLNMKYFNYETGFTMITEKFSKLFGNQIRESNQSLTQFHMDIASSIQAVIEEIVLKICMSIKEEYKIENLCIAGGVALNCVANGKILKKKIFKNLWIQPAAGDAGGSLGAALGYWHQDLNMERIVENKDKMKGSYLGPKFNNEEIEKNLNGLKARYHKKSDEEIFQETSYHLKNNKTVGWFQGRMEFGPRALGCRSILGNPLSEKMQKDLNLKIKFRESFRPFAPSIINEEVSNWFNTEEKSPYMLLVAEVKKDKQIEMNSYEKKLFGIDKLNIKRSSVPAITHVDYSARIQTVHKETNPRFYKLINAFKNLTGCPILVNTSFNVRGEPIVGSIQDAFKCFMGTNLDILVCENYMLFKSEQDKKLVNDYSKNIELD
jgi:carbamoyltransferase